MSPTFSDQDLEHVVEELPPVFSVVRRLMAVLNDPNSDVEDIAKLIRVDAALAAQVLRLANSPHYGLLERVGTIEEAIQHIGLTEILRLVAALAGRQVYTRDLSYYRVPASLMWQHTLAVAVSSEVVAINLLVPSDVAYMAGLLHGIGMGAFDAMAATRGLPSRDEATSLQVWEHRHFGASNATASSRVLQLWNFPDDIVAAIGARYDMPTPETIGRAGAALFLGSAIAEKIPAGLPAEHGLFSVPDTALATIRLSENRLADFELESRQRLSHMRALLNLG